MSRRTAAGLTALALLIAFAWFGQSEKVDFVTYKPGPTVDVLGEFDGKDIIEVSGREVYRDDGALRMVTVYQSGAEQKMSLVEMLIGWMDPDTAVLPRDAVYKPEVTEKQIREESAAQMTSSQDDAIAAALSVLDIDYRTRVTVASVVEDGASDGKLEADDTLVSIDRVEVTGSDQFVEQISDQSPGTTVQIKVRRDGKLQTIPVTTVATEEDPERSRIQVGIAGEYVFPFDVKINLSESIGGPSAGMMFAVSIYDVLTPGSLTGGKDIAGSGTLTADGVVGPIGGIGQKIAGAQRDGARLFLVAEENCAEAATAHYDKDKIRLVKVHTLDEAIDDIEAWGKDSKADLPGCA